MEQLLQKLLGDSGLGLIAVLLIFGVPYVVRTWKEVYSHQQELEKAKLQMDILHACMELTPSDDTVTVGRIRGIARRIAFDEELVGSPEVKVKALAPYFLVSLARFLVLCVITWVSFKIATGFYDQGGCFFLLAYAVGISWALIKYIKKKDDANEEPNLAATSLLVGGILGALGAFIRWVLS